MKPTTVLASTMLLPATLALSLSSHLTTSTNLLCSTIYDTSSAPLPLLTSTSTLQSPLELSPVVLHNYTTTTTTVTPKPFSTLFSVLATKTVTTEAQATNGTFYVTMTKFGTSTHWEHDTATKTVVSTRFLTSRTTKWVEAPTGFVGVRNNTVSASGSSAPSSAAVSNGNQKRRRSADAGKHPHFDSKRQQPSTSRKPKLVKPTSGNHAIKVQCKQWEEIHTTEVLLLTASKLATVTLRPETVYKNRTVYGTITSTILVSGSASTSASASTSLSAAVSQAKHKERKRDTLAFSITSPLTPIHSRGPLASIALSYLSSSSVVPTSIVTNTTTVTKTPYTISFTYTRTLTSTSVLTLHATTTVTSHAACATSNLLSQTSKNKRINGVSLPLAGQGIEQGIKTEVEVLQTENPEICCEHCVKREGCLWSTWQAEGKEKGSCYLTLLSNTSSQQKKRVNDDKQGTGEAGEAEQDAGKAEAQCPTQQAKAIFGYSGGNGEVRYVVSNGLCGFLTEA